MNVGRLPYILQEVLSTHSSQHWSIPNLANNFYADNFLRLYDSEVEAVREKLVIEQILADAVMSLQTWNSNSESFRNTYNVELDEQSMLGLVWEASL